MNYKGKQIQNSQHNYALYVITLHGSCTKNKAHCTLLQTQPQTLTKLVLRAGNISSARCSTTFGTLVARE